MRAKNSIIVTEMIVRTLLFPALISHFMKHVKHK